ncbi:MAG: GGDEF domain-containing protein [Devosia sp.]
MRLDSFTLLVAFCAAMIFLGFALLYFWNLDRASKWLLWWSMPFLIGGAAVIPYMRPDWASDFYSIGFGNAARITALCLLWQGARVFERRKPFVLVVLLTPVVWIGLCLIPPFFASMAARVVGVSLFNAAFCALAAYELWRGRAEALASRKPAIVVLLTFTALMLLRVATVNLLPFPMGALPLDPVWMGIFNLAVFVHASFLGFLLIALTKERREAEQRGFAILDPLTGLMNRRAFMSQVERSGRRRKFGREPLALLVLDLDHFKSINDRFGHDVGDRVLVAFATVAEACARPADQLYRMGGEEFCFILPDTTLLDAIAVAERVRKAFADNSVQTGRGRASATVSIGVAMTDHAGCDLELLLAAADAAVYEAKARGRNRVVVADPIALRQATPYPDSDFVQRRKSA